MQKQHLLASLLALFALASLGLARIVSSSGAASLSTAEMQNPIPTPAPTQIPIPIPTPWPGAVLEDPIAQLKALLLPVGVSVVESKLINVYNVRRYRTLIIEWKAYKDAPDLVDYDSTKFEHIKELKVINISTHDGTMQARRIAEIFNDEIFVVGVNENSELLWWTRLPDPRLLRSEWADSEGRLQGHRYHRSKVEFRVDAPENQDISEFIFYLPRSTVTGLVLDPLYAVLLNKK